MVFPESGVAGVVLPGEVVLPGVVLPGVVLPGVVLPGVVLPGVVLPGEVGLPGTGEAGEVGEGVVPGRVVCAKPGSAIKEAIAARPTKLVNRYFRG